MIESGEPFVDMSVEIGSCNEPSPWDIGDPIMGFMEAPTSMMSVRSVMLRVAEERRTSASFSSPKVTNTILWVSRVVH